MKLLLDENLSFKLKPALADVLPDCRHVGDLSLLQADDGAIWEAAKAGAFAIVSKDDDFVQRSLVLGFPPKVVHLQVGNRSTREIEIILRANLDRIREFADSAAESCLIIR